MYIIIISAVFPPEPIVSAKTSYSLALRLVNRNHNVRVITNFPNRPEGKLYNGYTRSLFLANIDPKGFFLTRCFSFISKESSIISRWMENISFGLTSSLSLLLTLKPDVVYSNSWPIFATGLICLVCKIRKIPIVISVQDLYPESLVVQGRLNSNHWLYKFLFSIDRWIANQATHLILLSESFARDYPRTRQINLTKVNIISNWIDQDTIILMDKDNYRKEVGISSDAFVIVYGGNIGKAAGVINIIQAMGKLNIEKEIALVVAGSGSELLECQKIASNIGNSNILFHTPWKQDEVSKVLAAADVLILSTQGEQSLASVPSKLLSYMLASKPVLAMVLPESDTAKVIIGCGCGWVIPPDNVNLLAEKIIELTRIPSRVLEDMGLSGHRYAKNNFTAGTSLSRVIEIIENGNREKKR
jgi:glycosyltransferase involved in cell wall biosynthesis